MPMNTVRLSPDTHELAREVLGGAWGRGLSDVSLRLEDVRAADGASAEMRYALGVKLIAERAPLRIDPRELLVGASTLRLATQHVLPVTAGAEGKAAFGSTSHTTPGFDRVLAVGYAGLRRQIDERLARGVDDKGADLLAAMRVCLDAAGIWHGRYVAELDARIAVSDGRQREHYLAVRSAAERVPENPPRSFRQAVQALWMLFDFHRLCGNWPGIGRVDRMLGPYLQADLAAGRITLDQARELLGHFWIKGCEWVGAVSCMRGSGDAQYYQNVVLGGIDEAGRDVTNEVTYLILDVVEELRINEFPIAVRIDPETPDRLLRRIAEVQRLGGGIVAIYNEPQIIQALVRFGYPLAEARDFANDGCWEILVPGHTSFGYCPFDTLALLQQTLGVGGDGEPAEFETFEDLYAAFRARLDAAVDDIQSTIDRTINPNAPTTLMSLFVADCIERARGYHNGGPRYTVRAPHAGGLPDTGNSLLAVRRLVYEQGRMTLGELVRTLRGDWAGQEPLRQEIANSGRFYGNDDAEADAMARRVFDDFLSAVAHVRERASVLRPPGVSTFGREIGWRAQRGATAAGRRAADILALNFSPSPGTDLRGPTAVIQSHCRMGLDRLTNGTALELKMHPSSVAGPAGLDCLVGLMRSFVRLGGVFLHVDVIDDAVLRDAQANPESHRGLAVRVSGWSARFVTLDRDWQDMVIRRTQQR